MGHTSNLTSKVAESYVLFLDMVHVKITLLEEVFLELYGSQVCQATKLNEKYKKAHSLGIHEVSMICPFFTASIC